MRCPVSYGIVQGAERFTQWDAEGCTEAEKRVRHPAPVVCGPETLSPVSLVSRTLKPLTTRPVSCRWISRPGEQSGAPRPVFVDAHGDIR